MVLNRIIDPGGILCYSKDFFEKIDVNEGVVSGFLTAIDSFAKEIKVGEIKALIFKIDVLKLKLKTKW